MQITQEQYAKLARPMGVFHHDVKVRTLLALSDEPKTASALAREMSAGSSFKFKSQTLWGHLNNVLVPSGYAEREARSEAVEQYDTSGYKLSPNIPDILIPWAIYHTGFVNSRGISMQRVLGNSKESDSDSSVLKRVKIIDLLAEGPKRAFDLTSVINTDRIDVHLHDLTQAGVISYDSTKQVQGRCPYLWSSDRTPESVKHTVGFGKYLREVAEVLFRHRGSSLRPDYIATQLKTEDKNMAGKVSKILAELQRQGFATPEKFSKKTGLSEAKLTEQGRDIFQDYILPFSRAFLNGDRTFMETETYNQLSTDSSKLEEGMNSMVLRAVGQSSKFGFRTSAETQKVLLHNLFLAGREGLTTNLLMDSIGRSRGGATKYLTKLIEIGVPRVKDGRTLKWFHPEHAPKGAQQFTV